MIHLLDRLGLHEPFYFLADAYYASGGVVRGLLEQGNHLVTRVKRNSVAYLTRPADAARDSVSGETEEVRTQDHDCLAADTTR